MLRALLSTLVRRKTTMTASAGHALRVLIIVENLPCPFDRRVWQEARTLHAAGHEVSIICPKGRGSESSFEVLEGIHIYRHALPLDARGASGYLLEYASALVREFALALRVFFTRGLDVVHACNPPDNIFLIGGFFKLVLGKKFLFDHHDLCPELYLAKFGRKDALYRLMLFWERWTFRLADVSIASNESYRRIAIERGRMAPERVFVVRSGPDLGRVRPVPADPRLRRGRRHLVGYVGVMGKQEGIQYLLQSIQYIVRSMGRRDIHFGLVGGGPELSRMQALAVELGVADHVTFTGRVSDDEMLAMLSTADVCVNPDEFNEMNDKSTMNKIMEYMALGKPIVQFDLSEGRVSAGGASLYARPNDAVDMAEKIVKLIDDPERGEAMGRMGQQRVREELSWDHEAPKLLAAYAALWTGVPAAARYGPLRGSARDWRRTG
jgi:glycosyltransferase involved in cell wall biosynthesis